MRLTDWDELVPLPEEVAARRYLDDRSLQAVGLLVSAATVGAVVPLIVFLTQQMWVNAAAVGVVLVANLALLLAREQPLFRRHVGLFLLAWAVLLLLVLTFAASEPMAAWSLATFLIVPGLLVGVRWRESHLWTLAAVAATMAAWTTRQGTGENSLPLLVVGTLWIAAMALVGRRLTTVRVTRFRAEFRRQDSLERERSRMRGELDDARVVQLSMLPHGAPDLPWVDFASVSVPASEVGGDYYDYFVVDEDRVAVVVGDVSGHGMASGLVLSAVRGGLHLLREQMSRPVEVLARLDAMLQVTTPGRMFVSLQLALIDRSRREILLANAGHPPAVFLGKTGPDSLGGPGKPLGTRLDGGFGEERRTYLPGDALILYTDGVTELRNYRGRAYGPERLAREAARRGADQGVKALRDRLLASLTHFRADVQQADDITLVVVGLESRG